MRGRKREKKYPPVVVRICNVQQIKKIWCGFFLSRRLSLLCSLAVEFDVWHTNTRDSLLLRFILRRTTLWLWPLSLYHSLSHTRTHIDQNFWESRFLFANERNGNVLSKTRFIDEEHSLVFIFFLYLQTFQFTYYTFAVLPPFDSINSTRGLSSN